MPEQIYIGNISSGQTTNRLPFVIDNDAFPTLFNFYTWRGRVKRKRGTITLGQMQVQVQSVLNAAPPANYQVGQIFTLDGSGNGSGNLISIFSLPSTSTIVPGSIHLYDGTNTYTEPATPDGTLVGAPGGSGSINYAAGTLIITGGAAGQILRGAASVVSFSYYPGNVSEGQRDFVQAAESIYPLMMSFDTTKAYQVNQTGTAYFYNVSFYKASQNPFVWSGADYQQFWTTNYAGALWATNGKAGFNFKALTNTLAGAKSVIRTGATTVTIGLTGHGLVTGDYIWINEVSGTVATGSGATANQNINGQTGIVTVIDANSFTGTFAGANFQAAAVGTGGIAQYLTQTIAGQDGIKWYDGDPTNTTGIPASTGLGWVNFAPPLTAATVSIEGSSTALYYLIGALAIVPFKDRILFFNPTIGTSAGTTIQLQDVVIWSWNGTPYYTTPVPTNQTADVRAYYVDQTGLGGYLSAGIDQPITTVSNNEDVLLIGFGGGRGRKTRFVYSGNDLNPFLFFNINSELPSTSTFSSINLDKGAIDIGAYGISLTDQQSSTRIDLDIPDSIFQISNLENGFQRVNAVRDFQKEWIYFSYSPSNSSWKYPTQTFLFNYRDNTWAVLYENYTSHGTFRYTSGETWATLPYNNWGEWVDPWNSGISSAQFPNIVGGTPQGYVQIIGEGTAEGPSCTISAIASANSGTATQITTYKHCLTDTNPNTGDGDFIYITGMLGTTDLNSLIGKVIEVVDADNIIVDLPFPSGTYKGLGVFAKLSHPLLQTKQFNPYWDQGRQVRLSCQKYLMDYTADAQVTVNVYLSQNPDTIWNAGPFFPNPNSFNDGLVYSQIMYTCPESTNLGLTPANTNLQMPTAQGQYQIWHRFNTSLIGDSVQIGITLSSEETEPGERDAQMYNLDYATAEITLHGIHLTVDRSSHLA